MGCYIDPSDTYGGNCWWWLRSPGNCPENAAFAHCYGFVSDDGGGVDYRSLGVRAALRLICHPMYGKMQEQFPRKKEKHFFR